MPSAKPIWLSSQASSATSDANTGPLRPPISPPVPGAVQSSSPRRDEGRLLRSHSRSSSQPLPRFISKRRGSSGRTRPLAYGDDFEDETDDQQLARLTSESLGLTAPNRPLAPDSATTARPCMCCGQGVRVGNDVKVFRCTDCLTVNDLEPRQARRLRGQRPGDAPSDGQNAEHNKRSPHLLPPTLALSLDRSKALAEQCIDAYLKIKVEEGASDSRKPDQSYFTYSPKAAIKGTSPGDAKVTNRMQDTPVATLHHPQDDVRGVVTADLPPSASIKSFADFNLFDFNLTPSPDATTRSGTPDVLSGSQRITRKPVPAPARQLSSTTTTTSLQAIPHPMHPPAPMSSTYHTRRAPSIPLTPEPRISAEQYNNAKLIFHALEEHLNEDYGCYETLNDSFSTSRSRMMGRTHSESALKTPPAETMRPVDANQLRDGGLPQIDAKTLLLGDFAENGDWWTGRVQRKGSELVESHHGHPGRQAVTPRSPCIDWARLDKWYELVQNPDKGWQGHVKIAVMTSDSERKSRDLDSSVKAAIDLDFKIAREHVGRSLFKATESLLKRPSRTMLEPQNLRFLLIILSNPLLYPRHVQERRFFAVRGKSSQPIAGLRRPSTMTGYQHDRAKHNGILKRCFGLLANSSDTCHKYLISWFSRMPEGRFLDLVDLVSSFVSHRLSKRKAVPKKVSYVDDNGLIPDLTGSALRTSTQLQRAAGLSGGVKTNESQGPGTVDYAEDWQLRAAAKVMALLFAANNKWSRQEQHAELVGDVQERDSRPRSKLRGQLLPTSDFYNSLLDCQDIITDFRVWEEKKDSFSFCLYPFFLSMSAKMRMLEYDAKRQQDTAARETFFNNVVLGRAQNVDFQLNVRRECVVEDSLKRIGEVAGGSSSDLKKTLRVHFTGEEGIDAGGLRKEWFLLLVRDIFDPDHGMFIYDDDSRLCYFNPNSFETSDQYYLVGVLLGLAIYNSTILDVPLPPFAFRKLLAAGPTGPSAIAIPGFRTTMGYTLDDLAELRPRLAKGLRQLLEFEGDVESTYLWSFTAPLERYGSTTEHELVPNGASRPVTNSNRHEFVSLYVRHVLDSAVARQFEPFKRGFFTVCAGNALSLFRAEEIELLVRGSDEARIDVDALRAVASHEGFRSPTPPHAHIRPADVPASVPVVRWFWDFFAAAEPRMQRRLLQFITSSDRVPATGAAGLVLRVVAGGDGSGTAPGEDRRFPVARTCFNMIVLWGWKSRERLEAMVRGAVEGSEGFGLK